MVSAVLMYAAGSEKEKRAGGSLHRDTIAQLFVFCKGGLAVEARAAVRRWGGEGGGVVCLGVRTASAEGLAWRAPLSHRPTLQRFWKQGDSPCTPGGGCAPAPCWGT